MVFKAAADQTRWEGLLVCVWLLITDGLLFLWAMRRPIDWIKFAFIFAVVFSLPLLLHWAYRTWTAFTLEYWIDRNAVTLRWANERRDIPLVHIRQIITGGVGDLSGNSRLRWPAPYVRSGRGLGVDNLTLAAAEPLAACLVLQTAEASYALSPRDGQAFVNALQERYALSRERFAPLPAPPPIPVYQRVFGRSRVGPILIGVGLLGVLVLVGVLMVNFPRLPDVLAFQYSSEGIPVAVRSKTALFLLPVIGFLAWLVNGFGGLLLASRDQLTGAYMLWGGTIVVQICSLLALISIIP